MPGPRSPGSLEELLLTGSPPLPVMGEELVGGDPVMGTPSL
jgi:hypothetical protein